MESQSLSQSSCASSATSSSSQRERMEVPPQITCAMETTPAVTAVDENEKERFVSERHEMIASILQVGCSAINARQPLPEQEAATVEAPEPTIEKKQAATIAVLPCAAAPHTPKFRRTNPVYVQPPPGAYSVEGPQTPLPCTESISESSGTQSEQQCEVDALERGTTAGTAVTSLSEVTATPVEAVVVEEQKAQMEHEIRQQILQEAVPAQVMNKSGTRAKRTGIVLLVSLLALGLGLGLGLGLTPKKEDNPQQINQLTTDPAAAESTTTELTEDPQSTTTLERVRQRGYLRCGVTEFGFINLTNPEEPTGFNVKQCQAMALAALGDSSQYEIVVCDHYTRFSYLANGTIDIMTEAATHTLARDVWVDIFQAGFSFTVPYFYSGLTFASPSQDYVDCADALDSFYGPCRDLKICVLDGSTHVEILRERIQGSALVPYNGTEALLGHLWQGTCNVAAGEPLYLVKVKEHYLEGAAESEWAIGSTVVSKEPLATVTREDDREWSTLANMVVNGFLLAEANNIKKENAQDMAGLFDSAAQSENLTRSGIHLPSLFVSLITEFGNYGTLYKQEIEMLIPRESNALNRPYDAGATTGLLYSIPFGNLLAERLQPSGTLLKAIYQRGYLKCGVPIFRGYAFARAIVANNNTQEMPAEAPSNSDEWAGFDVEFCRGLAASIFAGDKDRVVFTALSSEAESYLALLEEKVDVVAGARVSLAAQFHESTTGHGYAFSSPYYFDIATKDAFAFMAREDDAQWISFVYGVVTATVFAEEEGITSGIAADMPVVTLFEEQWEQERWKQMFRDCVASVGSYAELYSNGLQEFIPREGANRLNVDFAGPQMFQVSAI